MQVDISAHIEKLLFEHETLIVPSFGGFTATRSPSAVDFVGGSVAPPSKTLTFNENLTVDDGILVHDVSHAHGMSQDDARRVVLDFVEKTRDALSQREIVSLPGIGRLYKNYAQKIQFLPDTTNFNTESYGLPPLQFSPLARARETAEAAPAATGAPASGNGSAMPAATPAAVQEAPPVVVAPPTPQPATAAAQTPPPPPFVERSQQGSPMRSLAAFGLGLLIFAVVVGLYLAKRSRDTKQAQLAVGETTERTNVAPPIPGAGQIISEAQKAAEAEKSAEKKAATPGIEDDSKDDDTADEVEEAAAKKLEAAAAKKEEKRKAETAETESVSGSGEKRCVLVIGTFQDKGNAMKLLDKLKANKYDTYYRMQKGHQVGIEFQYEELSEIQAKIKALQKLTGEDDIWIKKK